MAMAMVDCGSRQPLPPMEMGGIEMTIEHTVNEPNLTTYRIDNRLTVAIAHDGTIETMAVIDDIRGMIDRFQLAHVTCLTIVIAQTIRYTVTAVTPSQTVWHITCQTVNQIPMAMNTIGICCRPWKWGNNVTTRPMGFDKPTIKYGGMVK